MVELVDEAELVPAQARAPGIVHGAGRPSADIDLAGIGLFEEAGDVQERRLAGAGRRDEGDDLARPDGEIGAAQDLETALALADSAARPGRGRAAGWRPFADAIRSSVAQGLDRIELRRAPGRVERGEERQDHRHAEHREDLGRIHLGGNRLRK